ncbi:MAG: hypothetical protein AB7P03_14450 [Kofleriaceae bacterium]
MKAIKAAFLCGVLSGLSLVGCADSGSSVDIEESTGDGKADSDIMTRVFVRNDATVRVQMKPFRNGDLNDSAEDQMKGKKSFGEVNLDEYILEVEDRMYKEISAVRIEDNVDVTNTKNVYVRVEYSDDLTGSAPGTVLGVRDGNDWSAIDFVWEYECDTRRVERNDGEFLVTVEPFTNDKLSDSAEDLMKGKKSFGDVTLDEYITDVKKRMYREVKAVNLETGADATDTNHIYVRVEYTDEIKDEAPGTVMGTAENNEFKALDFVFEAPECTASALDGGS